LLAHHWSPKWINHSVTMIAYQLVTNCVTREITQHARPLGYSPKQNGPFAQAKGRLGRAPWSGRELDLLDNEAQFQPIGQSRPE